MNPSIQRLRAEVASDVRLFGTRLDELAALPPLVSGSGPLAEAAVALHHAYGAIESALVRVARVFDGDVPAGSDWHQALLAAMELDLDGIRPAVLSPETTRALRRLLSFRHFFRHAYGVSLDPARVESIRAVALGVRVHVREDFKRLDDILRALADAS